MRTLCCGPLALLLSATSGCKGTGGVDVGPDEGQEAALSAFIQLGKLAVT